MAGQPTSYTEKIAEKICTRLVDGESLNKICQDKKMPCKATVYNWLSDPIHAGFLDKYIYARDRQAETFIDQCVDIADMTEHDTITKTTKDGQDYDVPNHEWITRSRLRVDTRIKIAEKLAPRKYAAKQDINIGMDEATLSIILSQFPKEYAEKVREAMAGMKKK